MRRVAVVVAILGLFGATRQLSADEAPRYWFPPVTPCVAVTPPFSERVTLEYRILQRDLHSGKVKLVDERSLTHTVGSRPDLEFQFEEFCMNCWATALTEVKTDLTETRQVRLEMRYQVGEEKERAANELRILRVETVELGRPIRLQLRRERRGVEYIVEIRAKPSVLPRIIRS